MKRIGSGAFDTGESISAKADRNGVTGHVDSNLSGILRNPVTIGSSGTLTVNGTLVIV